MKPPWDLDPIELRARLAFTLVVVAWSLVMFAMKQGCG
jgi:hypothetical protein